MKPDIFMDDFERTEWGDAHFAAIGRALVFATRFESLCKSLNVILGVKENRSVLESEDETQSFVNRIHKRCLAEQISSIVGKIEDLKDILDKARRARNEIVHKLTLGLDRCIDSLLETDVKYLMERLQELVVILAEADRIISFISSLETNEHIPSPEFLKNYPEKVREWVTNIEDIC